MPMSTPGSALLTWRTRWPISSGRVPPLVSHRTSVTEPVSRAARHAEGANLGVLERQSADFAEILEVLGIGERITPLDEIDAEFIEAARDEQLVLQREVDPLPLAAVAQRRVVDLDAWHDSSQR